MIVSKTFQRFLEDSNAGDDDLLRPIEEPVLVNSSDEVLPEDAENETKQRLEKLATGEVDGHENVKVEITERAAVRLFLDVFSLNLAARRGSTTCHLDDIERRMEQLVDDGFITILQQKSIEHVKNVKTFEALIDTLIDLVSVFVSGGALPKLTHVLESLKSLTYESLLASYQDGDFKIELADMTETQMVFALIGIAVREETVGKKGRLIVMMGKKKVEVQVKFSFYKFLVELGDIEHQLRTIYERVQKDPDNATTKDKLILRRSKLMMYTTGACSLMSKR